MTLSTPNSQQLGRPVPGTTRIRADGQVLCLDPKCDRTVSYVNTLCSPCHAAAMVHASIVVARVAREYKTTTDAIVLPNRSRGAASEARKAVVLALRRETWLSFPDIGRLLNRNRATVVYLAHAALRLVGGRPRSRPAASIVSNAVQHLEERTWEVWAGLESHGPCKAPTFTHACLRMFRGDDRFDPLALTLTGVPLTTLPMARVDR